MNIKTVSKFTCSVYRFTSPSIIKALEQCGIHDYYIQQSRAIVAVEKKGLFFSQGHHYMENIMDTYHFISDEKDEASIFEHIVKNAELNQEGRGSIYTEPAILIEKSGSGNEMEGLDSLTGHELHETGKLMGIYCIIQRGKGDDIAKAALDSGSCAPSVFYGIGGGVRDRMGLIRITIPPEKEMVNIVVAEHDCHGIMNLLIDSGNLERLGMGFIFSYPVNRAVMDTKNFIGTNRAAASVGQIVTAMDELIGNTTWRKRVINPQRTGERIFFENLENLMLICDDTRAKDMIAAAISAGARGATISKCRRISVAGENKTPSKTAHEISDMVISRNQERNIVTSLLGAGFFGDQVNGKIIIKKCAKAFSYTDPKK